MLPTNPKISIGMPVYNGEKYLHESIESILCQTYSDFELIISDNASQDSTEEICRSYATIDQRIRYLRNDTNVGIAKNFNRVVGLARGKYFAWAAHDDNHAETFIERCHEILEKEPSVILCYTKSKIINEDGEIVGVYSDNLDLRQPRPHERIRHLLINLNLVNALYGLIRTDALKKTRLIGTYFSSDYNTLLELCILGKYWEVPEYLFFRRDRRKNVRKMSLNEQALLLDPLNNSSFRHPQIRLIIEQWKSVSRLELDMYEKILCYFQLPQWVIRISKNKLGIYKRNIFNKFLKDNS